MRYKVLGRTGLRVSQAALGGGAIGTGWGWGADPAQSRVIFDRFAEAGGNFLDCADGYQGGQAEALFGEFLRGQRDNFVISTKYSGGIGGKGALGACGNSRAAMVRSLEGSLRRFGVDCLDLFYVHFADGVTPTEEIMRGFEDLTSAGKVRYVGFSNFPAWRIARAATLAELRGWPCVTAVQLEYSLVERTSERDLIPMCEALGIGVTVWAALGGGLLTGKYRHGGEGRLTHGGGRVLKETGERERAILDTLEAVAKELGASPAQVAIGWVLAKNRGGASAVIPILGARTPEQLDDNLGALTLAIDAGQIARLDEVSAIPLGYPHDWLASDTVRGLGGAGIADLIDPAPPVA